MTSHPCAARPSKGSSKNNKTMALNGRTTAIAMAKSEVSIREYDRERDVEAIEKLERSCEISTGKGFSIVTNMMGDPLCRIRLFPLHVMLVAEMINGGEEKELVGVVRGCVKRVATGLDDGSNTTVLAGYILGLRVSPSHRRKGIGAKLVNSIEAWASRHGARHAVAAADATNAASRALFAARRGYAPAARLSILVQPLLDGFLTPAPVPAKVRIERLAVEQAARMYKRRFGGEPLCPSDLDAVLNAAPSLGTWVARLAAGDGGAWACISLWNTCATYRMQVVSPAPPRRTTWRGRLAAVALTTPPCMGGGVAVRRGGGGATACGEFGFVIAYGIDGEGGVAVRALVRALWGLAASEARRVSGEFCNALVVEADAGDAVARHVPRGRRAWRVDDVWLVKSGGGGGAAHALPVAGTARRRFVDPRDF